MERLRTDILLGKFKPGSRLPPERELAAHMNTNRNTLREALRILESENLIRSRQGDGTTVRNWRSEGEINLLPAFLQEETSVTERLSAVATLLRLRENLLDLAVRRAAEEHKLPDLEALVEAVGALRKAGLKERVSRDIDVYRALVLASHDLVLIWSFNTFAKIFVELGSRFPEVWRIDDGYLRGLDRIVTFIRDRRADRAGEELNRVFDERGLALAAHLNPALSSRKAKRSDA